MLLNAALGKKRSLNFLVIDDDPTIGECLSLIISMSGHSSTYFTNPHEAVNQFQLNPVRYQAIFTDLRMPGMHGDEVIAHIRSIRKEIPIVIITGTIITVSKKDRQENRIIDIVSKPFDISTIEEVINRCEERYIIDSQYSTWLREIETHTRTNKNLPLQEAANTIFTINQPLH